MKRSLLLTLVLSGAMILPLSSLGQRPGSSGSSRSTTTSSRQATPRTNTSTSARQATPRTNTSTSARQATTTSTRNATTVRPNTSTARPNTSTARPNTSTARPNTSTARPNTSTARPNTTTVRPNNSTVQQNTSTARPNTSTARPNTTTTRPATTTSTTRPSTSTSTVRPSQQVTATTERENASVVRPGDQTVNVRSSNSDNSSTRPGVNGHPGNNGGGHFGNNPGGNSVRPDAPGYNHSHAQNSLKRPGTTYRPGPRPNYNYTHHGYRPPRPHGGYWGAPPMNPFRRPVIYFPPMPPRVTYVSYGVPTIGTILGLTFGSFIDAGINALFNGGYNVLGYANNAVYVGNVSHFGYIWPETTVYYTDGLMSNAQFQSWSQTPDQWRFNNIYRQLVNTYGAPVQANTYNGITTASWWAGNNTGYITLQYGPGLGSNNLTNYYTTLTYGDGYDY